MSPSVTARGKRAIAVSAIAAAAAATLAGFATPAHGVDAFWIAGMSGFWSNPANWSTPEFPNNGTPPGTTYDVTIDSGVPGGVVVSIETSQTRTIDNLTIGAGDELAILNNANLVVSGSAPGTVTNDGILRIAAGLSTTEFRIANDTLLTGNGRMVLDANPARVTGSGGRLTNDVNHTIEGRGFLGLDSIFFTNLGLVDANVSGATLTVDPADDAGIDDFINQGTLRASSGGILVLTGSGGGEFNNVGGVIEALDASVVRLSSGASITGGTLQTAGSGAVRVQGSHSAHVTDLANTGALILENNATLFTNGTIVNSGSIAVAGGLSVTDMALASDTTLAGGGVLTLSGSSPRIVGSHLLTNSAGHTIEGRGSLGVNQTSFINAGLIHANLAGLAMTVDPAPAGGLVNTGVLRASGEGILELSGNGGGAFNNTGGSIEALDESIVRLRSGASITGGTLQTAGSGTVRVFGSNTAHISGLVNAGALVLENNATLVTNGTIVNSGSIAIAGGLSVTDMALASDTTLAGGGVVSLSGSSPRILGSHLLTNAAGHTIQGRGSLGLNQTSFVNNGLIDANALGLALTVDPAPAGGLINNSIMRASGGGILELTGSGGGDFGNSAGAIEALDGSLVRLVSNASITGGTIQSFGTGQVNVAASQTATFADLIHNADTRILNNGLLLTQGLITNNATITIDGGLSTTSLNLAADTTLAGTGTVVMPIGTARIAGTGALTNGPDHTIEGRGIIGNNVLTMLNQGLISANLSGVTLTVDPAPGAGAFINDGIVRAVAGGTLSLTGNGGGDFTNNGVFEALDDGTFTHAGGATLTNFAAGTLTGGSYRAIDHGSGATINLPTTSIVHLAAEAVVSGPNASFPQITNTLQSVSGALRVDDGNSLPAPGNLSNTGTVLVGTSATPGGSSAILTLDGGAATLTNHGLLGGVGSVVGHVLNPDGVVAPGSSPGHLTITGGFDQASGGTLEIEIGGLNPGTEHDLLTADSAMLDGTLLVNLVNGFMPTLGDEFTILSTLTGVSGTFSAESLPFGFHVIYEPELVKLQYIPEPGAAVALMGAATLVLW